MQRWCFSFEQHLGRWAVFRQLFHHAERAPRVTSSLTAESPTIQKLQNILGVDIGILATQIMRARKTRKRICVREQIPILGLFEVIGDNFMASEAKDL